MYTHMYVCIYIYIYIYIYSMHTLCLLLAISLSLYVMVYCIVRYHIGWCHIISYYSIMHIILNIISIANIVTLYVYIYIYIYIYIHSGHTYYICVTNIWAFISCTVLPILVYHIMLHWNGGGSAEMKKRS